MSDKSPQRDRLSALQCSRCRRPFRWLSTYGNYAVAVAEMSNEMYRPTNFPMNQWTTEILAMRTILSLHSRHVLRTMALNFHRFHFLFPLQSLLLTMMMKVMIVIAVLWQ